MTPGRRDWLARHISGFIRELIVLLCDAPQQVTQELDIRDECITVNVIFNHVPACHSNDSTIRCTHIGDCSRFVGIAGQTVINIRELLNIVGGKYHIPQTLLLVTDPQSGQPTALAHAARPRPLEERLQSALLKKQQTKV